MTRILSILLISLACASAQVETLLLMQRAVIAAAVFYPTNLPNCDIWLASEGVLIGADTTASGIWTNLATNAVSPTTTASTRPTVLNDAINGQRAFKFDGSNDKLDWTDSTFTNNIGSGKSGFTAFLVLKRADAVANDGIFYISNTNHGEALFQVKTDSVTNKFLVSGRREIGEGADASDTVAYPLDWSIITAVADWADSACYLYTNGVAAVSDTTWTTSGTTSPLPSTLCRVGGSSGSYWNGWMAEIILYSRKLSDTDRETVENYLKAKFGL